ncbi:MAG: hypothetical protein OXQ90_00465 [Gammaproteobacteria bacterium]|nr:hypothetical protein [Gammaproteobacteria bacterium]
MHLQQTKKGSIKSGGPQYYFHELTESVSVYLRSKGAVPVALVTPYGATRSDFFALGKDHKLSRDGKVVPGKVGHDRIQQGAAGQSIGEAIRDWYRLRTGNFDRIDLDVQVIDDTFYVTPLRCRYTSKPHKSVALPLVDRPLTFTTNYQSPFWRQQLAAVDRKLALWSLEEICRIVADHRPSTKLRHIQEPDILRASGPLHHLGLKLGGFVGKGYDCLSSFQFDRFPPYKVPVEVKRNSYGFNYQMQKYGKDLLSRAVILCAIHDHKHIPVNIDVIELDALCAYLPILRAA